MKKSNCDNSKTVEYKEKKLFYEKAKKVLVKNAQLRVLFNPALA